MNNMKITKKILTALIVASISAAPAMAQIKILDRVIAVVNNIAVTQSQLDNRIEEVKVNSRARGVSLPSTDILKQQVIDQLIVESLQIDLAKRYELVIPDEEVNASILDIINTNKITEAGLLKQLEADGVTYNEFREGLRRQIMIRTITEGIVSRRIRISEQEVDNFLQSADAQFWAKPDYRLGHILVGLPSSASSEQIAQLEAKANNLYKQLSEGANFANTAIAQSNGQLALKGGDLGWRKPSQLPTLFASALDELKTGEISKPIRSQAGFHIIKLYEVRGEQKRIVQQNRSRHILLKTSEILNDAQAEEKLKALKERILKGEDFAELAKKHTDDIATRTAGGSLGWATPGQFVPAFEKAIAETPIMEISEPFKSQFGWHILQVEEKRDEDMTEQALRGRARNLILGRRFADETQIWIQELRDDAHIDIKI